MIEFAIIFALFILAVVAAIRGLLYPDIDDDSELGV